MRRLCGLSLTGLCLVWPAMAQDAVLTAPDLEQAVQRIASEQVLWPGYQPLEVPLAVFDGSHTYLFRHPDPPAEFRKSDGSYVFEGRHPMVVANTSATIGGVSTATVDLASRSPGATLNDVAAVVLHEGFHVFQATTGRKWGADETYLFIYPVDDADLLAMRHLETEALRRGLEATDMAHTAGWVETALEMRRQRFEGMAPAFAAYERGIETHEGTATYVEYKAAGRERPVLPAGGFDPEEVRRRAYYTGAAFAVLLDSFDLDWRQGFADEDSLLLDTMVAQALKGSACAPGCSLSSSEKAAITVGARADARALQERWRSEREAYESSPGWQVIVEAPEGSPLWPQGFDPMNVRRVEGGLLHSRFLRLRNDMGALEVMGDTVLTEGVGAHPLLSGVKRVIVAGFETEPEVTTENGEIRLDLASVTAAFRGAAVLRSEGKVVIKLGSR
jgi:hypothetical protein